MEFEVDLKILKALLPLTPKTDIHYYLNGVYVKFEATKTIYVATNGQDVARVHISDPKFLGLIMPFRE
jgi:DNA polymerase III sliding clamp (beta) subunit (PCNA family)